MAMWPTRNLLLFWCLITDLVWLALSTVATDSSQLFQLPECPAHCNCINSIIDCSCEQPQDSMELSSFKGLEYIQDVHIHSCQSVHIKANTFEGLKLTNDLTISGVAQLKLSAFAFRKMRKGPIRLFIKNSHLDQVVPHTFAGFASAQHMWFRNVSIDVIHSYGFADVTNVHNVYFREVKVKHMQPRAFARMTGIENFFLKEKISIGAMGEEIFDGAKMGQVYISDAQIASMHTHAITGFHAVDSIELTSVTFHNLTGPIATPHNSGGVRLFEPLRDDPEIRADLTSWEQNVAKYKSKGPQVKPRLSLLSISDSSAQLFALDSFSNVEEIRLQNFTIGKLIASQSLDPDANDNANLYSLGRRSTPDHLPSAKRTNLLHISNCLISKVDRFAFFAPIGTIVFERSVVRNFAEFAFHNLQQINSLLFLNSEVDQLHPHAFYNCTIGDIIFDSCTMGKISSEAFDKTKLKLLKICGSRLTILQSKIFRHSEAEKLEFESNSVAELHEAAFTGIVTTKSSNFIKNQFNFTSLNGLAGISTNFLRLQQNQFKCDCSQHLFNDIYYFDALSRDRTSYTHDIMSVSDNRCATELTNVTLTIGDFVSKCPSYHHQQALNTADITDGLRCHSKSLATECECISPRQSVTLDPDLAAELPRFTSVLWIRQCREALEVEPHSFAKTSISTVKFSEVTVSLHSHAFAEMPNLLHLQFHRSIVQRLRSSSLTFTKRQCRSFKLMDSVVNNGLPTDLLTGTHIGSFEMIKSRIEGIHSNFLGQNFHIERMSIVESTVTRIDEFGFQNVQNLKSVEISKSIFTEISSKAFQRHFLVLATGKDELLSNRHWCFYDNVLNCSCSLGTYLSVSN